MTLATRCPSCQTLFKVVPDQLRVSEGWVRCGRCAEVFNAAQHLTLFSHLRTNLLLLFGWFRCRFGCLLLNFLSAQAEETAPDFLSLSDGNRRLSFLCGLRDGLKHFVGFSTKDFLPCQREKSKARTHIEGAIERLCTKQIS